MYQKKYLNAKIKSLSHIEFFELLLEDENNNRRGNSYKKRYAKAKFPQRKTIGYVFTDNLLASAILDRIVHYSEIIKINGQSYRSKN